MPVESSSHGSVVSVSGVVGWEGGGEVKEEEVGGGVISAVSVDEGTREDEVVAREGGGMASGFFSFSSPSWGIAGWEVIGTAVASIFLREIVYLFCFDIFCFALI